MRVVCVGGGIVGMLSTLFLARAGIDVVLTEIGSFGGESSWAGGGIVSPLYPWRYDSAVTALARWSQAFYPILARQLHVQANLDPEVYVSGLYWLDLDDDADALAWSEREGAGLEQVDIRSVRLAVPALALDYERAIYMANAANVRNPRLLKALRHALQSMPNVSLREHCDVTGFIRSGCRISGVHSSHGDIHADQVVVCAGAWSGNLMSGLGPVLPIAPVKGQMILYKCSKDFLSSMVLMRGRYAIPRRDGHILVGSTLEYVGFDKTPTDEALQCLRASAEQLLPALAGSPVVGHWAGLRPGSPHGVPFIGGVPAFPGLWLNCGHYRNGLVLAPASCQLLADLILGREPIVDPAPYCPAGRFG
ncbi:MULTISPECIES: FAD-dependent oxidoreductase [unclassified Pseudomonas]|uniref:NAD(P)/FAD-dependent oxidoreductase n=1 Tax=unclassified Pseudomonas TaxID=196821 RepID=UPI0024470E81|nr:MULTISPECIES: FAD-dependent oxidoreductase [unclassified Pseudomonas]MDG9922191.1 FAD-dependent oxidoreductase [Pseudomonas sp. GD04045]MDH0033716.1 FAD-dependent oxidoreductase [Pseudomonas sp. GD04019]